jgi:hypothetical protein
MNRFRLVLAFVFLAAGGLILAGYVALQAGIGPSPEESQIVLWDVLREDGIWLAAISVLLGVGWAYFGKIFTSPATPEPTA